MPEIDLARMRALRRRAEELLKTLVDDLKPFRHGTLRNGYRRRPDSPSPSDDVNVTTTCSCMMALALAGRLEDLYGDTWKKDVADTLSVIIDAPWMSSGLQENNAFTSTLVLRLVGFVRNSGGADPASVKRRWERQLDFSKPRAFAKRLADSSDPVSRYLFEFLPSGSQSVVSDFANTGNNQEPAVDQMRSEFGRLIRTGSIYDSKRFDGIKLSPATEKLLKSSRNGYLMAQLNRCLLDDAFPNEIVPLTKKSISEIAAEMAKDPSHLEINAYPSSAAVVYWFVDGVQRANIVLPHLHWDSLCAWATEEFTRQRSLVAAKHAAMMDPVAMAMAACLCARLRRISGQALLGADKDSHSTLPSDVELKDAIASLFGEQTRSGIWPKYFPLFHYQDAGSNFCFTFELLEAVLVEFGAYADLVENVATLDALERGIRWCEENRLQYLAKEPGLAADVLYRGWNSGGNLPTLRRGQPESWATAVVHMFLWELVEVLSQHIQKDLLDRYHATYSAKTLKQLLDIELQLPGGPTGIIEILGSTIGKTFGGKTPGELRKAPVRRGLPVSALLFGPPGTSKTQVAKALAGELGWPLVEIDPSHFLQDSFQNIYVQAERIFEDLMDLSGVVVLFDEMDALVQKRDTETAVDTESKFLTTYMLPKLAKLHDKGQIAFLMATNFQAKFDDAIKRAGRFDYLLCMGPPTLTAKCDGLHLFFDLKKGTPQTEAAGKLIKAYCGKDVKLGNQLELYTFGEFQSLITTIGAASDIDKAIEGLGAAGLSKRVKDDCKSVGLIADALEDLRQVAGLSKWESLKELFALDCDTDKVANETKSKAPVIRYFLDRRQTRRQCPKAP